MHRVPQRVALVPPLGSADDPAGDPPPALEEHVA